MVSDSACNGAMAAWMLGAWRRRNVNGSADLPPVVVGILTIVGEFQLFYLTMGKNCRTENTGIDHRVEDSSSCRRCKIEGQVDLFVGESQTAAHRGSGSRLLESVT